MTDVKAHKSLKSLAERMRFELTIGFPLYALSRGAPQKHKTPFPVAKSPSEPTSRHDSTQHTTGTSEHFRWSDGFPYVNRQAHKHPAPAV